MLPPSHRSGEDLFEDLEVGCIEWTWREWVKDKYAHVSASITRTCPAAAAQQKQFIHL
jgi:hypothetical protein